MLLISTLIVSLVTGLVAANPIPGQTNVAPPAESVYIESVTWGGTGCTMGANADTTYVLSDDRETLTIIYENYVAVAGPAVTNPALNRRNCDINIKVNIPNNWQFTVSTTIFRGFQQMGKSCSGFIAASYWFSGQTQTVTGTCDFDYKDDPTPGDYEKTTTVLAVWPKCNVPTMFNINSQAFVSCSGKDQAQLTVDSIDHTYQEQYLLLWQPCK